MILILASGVAIFGLILYKFILFRFSWRWIFIIGIVMNGFVSLLQLLLVTGHTFGMNQFLFALGDDAMMEFIMGTQYIVSLSLSGWCLTVLISFGYLNELGQNQMLLTLCSANSVKPSLPLSCSYRWYQQEWKGLGT